MQYISPIRFYEHCGIDVNDTSATTQSRIKKIITAEFAIAHEGIIRVADFDYNKNNLLTDIDSPDWQQNLEYHKTIWENPLLLQILEQDKIMIRQPRSRPKWYDLSQNTDFVNFVSPYFSEALNLLLKRYYSPAKFNDARYWMTLLSFVNADDQEVALASTRAFLDSSVALFKNMNSVTYQHEMAELRPWISQPWHYFINELPDSLFYYKESIADAMVDFISVVYQNDIDTAYSLNSRLISVSGLNSSLMGIIHENYNTLSRAKDRMVDTEYADTGGSEGGGGSGVGTVLSIIAVVIFVIRLMIMCSR